MWRVFFYFYVSFLFFLSNSEALPLSCAQVFSSSKRIVVSQDSQWQRAMQSYGRGQLQEALQWATILHQLNPRHSANLILLSHIYRDLNQPDLKERYLLKAVSVSESPSIELNLLIDHYQSKKDWERLAQTLARFIELESRADEMTREQRVRVLSLKAKLHALEGQLELAVESLEELVNLSPQDALAHSLLGRWLLALGQSQRALFHITRAQKLEPRKTVIFQQKMSALLAVRDYLSLQRAIDKMGGLAKHYYQAALYVVQGEWEMALSQFNGIDPLPLSFLRLRAQVHYSMGRMDLALADLKSLARQAQIMDLFTVIALYRIEIMDMPIKDFEPSPLLQAMIDKLTPGEWSLFWRYKDQAPWIFELDAQMEAAPSSGDYMNSIWSETEIYRPVDGQAVRELKSR
jgi:tetratricopeptide (TPR) repeat protein